MKCVQNKLQHFLESRATCVGSSANDRRIYGVYVRTSSVGTHWPKKQSFWKWLWLQPLCELNSALVLSWRSYWRGSVDMVLICLKIPYRFLKT